MRFQSTPAIAGGRCPNEAPAGGQLLGFNPRPPLLAGDALRAQTISTTKEIMPDTRIKQM
jgi:hypothetical protein